MTTTWILVASRSGASLFESNWPGETMRRLQDIPHPEGRLQNSEIDSDKPGRAFDSMGEARHSMSKELDATEKVAQQFARELAELLNKNRNTNVYDKIILMAAPKFLGLLRAALDSNTAALVVQTVNKELLEVSQEDVISYLK